jgi:hypothetical protein
MALSTKARVQDPSDFKPLPEGDYNLEILKAEECESKKGTPMLKLQLQIEDTKRQIFKYLMFDGREISQKQITDFAKSLGVKVEDGDEVSFDDEEIQDMAGQTVRAKVGIEEGNNGYPDKNCVKWFYWKGQKPKADTKAAMATAMKANSKKAAVEASYDEPDDIPF